MKGYEVKNFFTTYVSKYVEANSFEEAAKKALHDDSTGEWEQSNFSCDGEEVYVFDEDGNDYLYVIAEGE